MRDLTVRRYHPSDRIAWDAFVRSAPDSSIYHQSWWMDVMARCFPHENTSMLACDDEQHVRAVLPLFRINGSLKSRLVSVPLRDQAGILGDVRGTGALLREAIAWTARHGCAYLTLKQGRALRHAEEVEGNRLLPSSYWVTTEVPLPVDVRSHQVSDSALRNVRKAERNALKICCGSGAVLADRFYRLFRETRKRLGVPTYSRDFFLTLATFPEHVNIILCSKDGRDLAGAVILYSNCKAVYGYAASSLFLRELRAADLVVWTALNWASAQRLSIFDFGADSPLQTDLIRFKTKWGGTTRMLHYYHYLHTGRRVPGRDHAAPGWQWIRKAVSLLPDAPFERLSRCVVQRVD